jgi:hypothetical protein
MFLLILKIQTQICRFCPLRDNDKVASMKKKMKKGMYALWQLRKTGSTDRREERPKLFISINRTKGGLDYSNRTTG